MRTHILVVLTFMQSCGSASTGDESSAAADLAAAEQLEKQLAPQLLEILFKEDPKVELGFPVLESQARCGGDVVKASYDPYRDVLSVAFVKDGVLAADARTLTFNGSRVWSAKNPFKGDQTILTVEGAKSNVDTSWGWVEDVSTKYPKLFPVGTDVEIQLGGTTMFASKVSGTEFKWSAAKFSGWRMKLYVFSRDQVKAMLDHKTAAKSGYVELKVLSAHTAEVDKLRKSKDPKATAVVRRYDELMAAATKKREATKTVPFVEHKDSFSVQKAPACAQ